jgi:hypothetical protein
LALTQAITRFFTNRLAKEYGVDLVAAEKPTLMHPAFYGFLNIHSRPFDSAVINPIFFNHRVVPVRLAWMCKKRLCAFGNLLLAHRVCKFMVH